MSEQLTSLPQQYPAAAALLTEHGDKTLRAYLTQLRLRPLPDILPSEDLLTAVRDYFVPFFGTETAEEAAAVLRRCRCPVRRRTLHVYRAAGCSHPALRPTADKIS